MALVAALDAHRRKHHKYPSALTDLGPEYQASTRSGKGWDYYGADSDSYNLYYKLNWDAGLRYEASRPEHQRWFYDPGDGSQRTVTLPW